MRESACRLSKPEPNDEPKSSPEGTPKPEGKPTPKGEPKPKDEPKPKPKPSRNLSCNGAAAGLIKPMPPPTARHMTAIAKGRTST